MGLVSMVTPFEMMDPFGDGVNWHYNYAMKTTDDETEFLNKHNIEYIPMFIHETMWAPNCSFKVTDPTAWNYCSVDKIVTYLEETQSKLTVPMTKILGFNEAWDDRSASKWIEPTQQAEYWKIVQQIAKATNLSLVSPTYSTEHSHIEWFAEFLNACYLMRDDEVPCTVEEIEIFATHEYFCVEDIWREEYTPETGLIITNLIAALEDLAEEHDYTYDWNSYVNARDYMVTETNCTWD